MQQNQPPSGLAPARPEPGLGGAWNSVSTRIIASVFVATALTAAAVSTLAIRALHLDHATRLARGLDHLVEQRQQSWARHQTELAGALRAAAAPGTPWHAGLFEARTAVGSTPASPLRWARTLPATAAGSASAGEAGATLPEPPQNIVERFDRILWADAETRESEAESCLAVEAEIRELDGSAAGRLIACVAHESIAPLLAAGPADLGAPRVVVTDLRGVVSSAAGPGGATRLGARIPIGDLIANRGTALSDYSDGAGRALVGIAAPLGRSGFFVVAETEHARAFAAAIAIERTIFVVDVCIVLFFSVLAFQVTQAIMRPIHALSAGAQRILEGHIDHQIPAPAIRDDELGLLTHTFNEMMRKLRASQLEIERDRIRLAEKNDELQSANEVLSQLSITDGLTKLHNHRYFQDHLTREIKRVSRTNTPLALILIDIDDFKLLNDTHGHAAGDEVLISIASIMNETARESDLIARYGGEEFVILMPNTDLAGAVHLAEKIRMSVESTRLIIGDRMKPVEVTISLGVALYGGNRRDFFAEADRALYRAKAAGKNCVILAGTEGPSVQ